MILLEKYEKYMMNSALIKRLFKRTIPLLPGYHSLCLVLQKHRPKNCKWIDEGKIFGAQVIHSTTFGPPSHHPITIAIADVCAMNIFQSDEYK